MRKYVENLNGYTLLQNIMSPAPIGESKLTDGTNANWRNCRIRFSRKYLCFVHLLLGSGVSLKFPQKRRDGGQIKATVCREEHILKCIFFQTELRKRQMRSERMG